MTLSQDLETLIRWRKEGGGTEETEPDFIEFHCEVVSKKVVRRQVAAWA